MDKLLITGVETIAGANLAAVFGQSVETTGLTTRPGIGIECCRVLPVSNSGRTAIQQIVQSEQPDEIIYCGAAAQSCWEKHNEVAANSDSDAVDWADIASSHDIGFTLISSDAIFSGPWMLHDEDCSSFCETPQARRLRQIETDVLGAHPGALVVRTHVFGWSADADRPGFAASLHSELEDSTAGALDCLGHSSPILASDFATMLHEAFEAGLTGTLHIGGGERTNAFQFAETLAAHAGLAQPVAQQTTELNGPVTGFGRGETSLDSSLVREQIGITPPLIQEGISRFLEQSTNGFKDRLQAGGQSESRVA